MIIESGKVMAVESDGVWVETANQSACGRCSARKGCGQSLLAQVDGHRSYIKAAFNGHSVETIREGDHISIGIHETAVLRGSLMVYSVPLLGLILGAGLGNALVLAEAWVVAFAGLGFFGAAMGVRAYTKRCGGDSHYQPVIVDLSGADKVIKNISVESAQAVKS